MATKVMMSAPKRDGGLPKTRKSLFGNKEITTSRDKNPKTNQIVKSKYTKNPDGSSKTKIVEKKPGPFARKETTTIYRGTNQDDVMTEKRIRKKGVLPKVKTTTTDNLMREKSVKKNFLYKLGSRGERKKMKGDVRGESERFTPKNCLKGSCSAGIKK
jgi:hypothetical protein